MTCENCDGCGCADDKLEFVVEEMSSIKTVQVSRMTSTEWMRTRDKLAAKGKHVSDATLEPFQAGFMVIYNYGKSDEYWSWSPTDQIHKGYVKRKGTEGVIKVD